VEPLARRGPLGKEDFPGGMQVLLAKTAAQGEEQAASRAMFKEGLVETRGDREENLQEKVETIWAGKEARFQGQEGPPVRAKAGAQGRGKVESKALETEGMEGVMCVSRWNLPTCSLCWKRTRPRGVRCCRMGSVNPQILLKPVAVWVAWRWIPSRNASDRVSRTCTPGDVMHFTNVNRYAQPPWCLYVLRGSIRKKTFTIMFFMIILGLKILKLSSDSRKNVVTRC
jgi:hypothetical protein